MTAMPPLRPILNDMPATAIDVDWNFQAIEDYVATDLIHKDGSVAMEAPLQLNGPAPSQPSHAVPLSYVGDSVLPVGIVWQFAGPDNKVPAGWALCDGLSKSTTDPAYVALFAVIGYTYGGSGGNFNLPNFQNRMPVGKGTAAWSDALGESGGSKDQQLITHAHTVNNHTHDLANHTHGDVHLHHTDPAVAPGGGGWGTLGNPSGWTNAPGSGVIYGEPWYLEELTASVFGNRRPYACSPANWFQERVMVDIPATATNYQDANATGGPAPNSSGGAAPGTNTAGTLAAGTDANLPPYVTVNFIIRIG